MKQIKATDTISMADYKKAMKMVKNTCINLKDTDFILVLPKHYKKFSKEVEKVKERYLRAGMKVVVSYNNYIKGE